MKRADWREQIAHLEQFYTDDREQIEADMFEYFQGLSADERQRIKDVAKMTTDTNCGFKTYRTAQAFLRLCQSSLSA